VRISIVVVSVFTIGYLFCLVFGIDLSLIFGKLKSMLLVRSFRVLVSRLLGWEVPIFVLVFFVGLELDSSLHMQDPAGALAAANPAAEQPFDVPSGASTSALEARAEELIITNLLQRKGALGGGQEVSEVRQALEAHFDVHSKPEQFQLIRQMERELTPTENEEKPPVTTVSLNEVKEYESHIQDGRGGGKPNFYPRV